MKNNFSKYIIAAFFLIMVSNLMAQQDIQLSTRPWKGNAILGNGNICLVYSDDARMTKITKGKGIQHFYLNDYTTDYIASTTFDVFDERGNTVKIVEDSVGLENFFTTITRTLFSNGSYKDVKCFVHPENAVVLSLDLKNSKIPTTTSCQIHLRKNIITDRKTILSSFKKEDNVAIAQWTNGTYIIFAPKVIGKEISINDSIITISCRNKEEILILAGTSLNELKANLKILRLEKSLSAASSKFWNSWMNSGKLPKIKNNKDGVKYLDYYKRTLYSVKAANLNGMVPADITGQFLTNGMPQLYPRDAMMSARAFLLTGHYDEAKQIISFWAKPEIPKKSAGEYFARYDAYSKAVDAGSGARYDEPEWDANGYFIWLVNEFYKQKLEWLADKSLIFELADFLVSKIDENGLLYEGGIVEWTGYLPTTNMICAAALKTASKFAERFGDPKRTEKYEDAFEKISSSLDFTFDKKRQTYTAVRFTGIKTEDNRSIADKKGEKINLWDTTIPFGVLWGFPENDEVKKSVEFYLKNTTVLGGGLQYFEAKDNAWLSGYGGDAFFFPTAALSQYFSITGNPTAAIKHIDWMINNSNSYGLMPERIYLNESDCSPASPLSWCNGEFALAVLMWSEKQ
ncbi:MAG: hypothetical protein NTX22_09310 [Ignavibacteriales bacterium]|nr:hypothetical protein [Ignavibacteriales bacterium]